MTVESRAARLEELATDIYWAVKSGEWVADYLLSIPVDIANCVEVSQATRGLWTGAHDLHVDVLVGN